MGLARKGKDTRMDLVAWAVKEFMKTFGRTHGNRPLEFRVIYNFLSRESERKYVRALGIRFELRPEFMLMSIERPDTGIETMFDGSAKLVTLHEWGWNKKELLAADVKDLESTKDRAHVVPIRPLKFHMG
jgi:hypothetical protein